MDRDGQAGLATFPAYVYKNEPNPGQVQALGWFEPCMAACGSCCLLELCQCAVRSVHADVQCDGPIHPHPLAASQAGPARLQPKRAAGLVGRLARLAGQLLMQLSWRLAQ